MKKLFALLLTVMMALLGVVATPHATTNHIDLDTTEATKAVEWQIAYYGRCRKMVTRKTRERRNLRRIGKVLALPALLMLGVYNVGLNGRVVAQYDRYGDAKLHAIKLGDKAVVTQPPKENKTKEQIARDSDLGFIRKIHLANDSEEYIPMPRCGLRRKDAKLGIKPFDAFIKVDAHVKESDKEGVEIGIAEVRHISADKYIDKHGCAWTPLLSSASDRRKGTFLCVREDLYTKFRKWLLPGLNVRNIKMVVSKYLVYLGLQTSASKTMKEVFGWSFDVHRVAIIPDLNGETATAKDALFVEANNKVWLKKSHKEPLNIIDGMGMFFKNMFVKKPFTLRFAGIKGAVAPMSRGEVKEYYAIKKGGCDPKDNKAIREWIKAHNNEICIQTIDGPVQIDKIDLVITESMWKFKGLYKNTKAWADACVTNGYEFSVCVNHHAPTLKSMPYQQGQLLRGNSADALALASHAKTVVTSWRDPKKAAQILPGYIGAACEMMPSLLKTRYIQKLLQDMYTKKRNEMIGGKVPNAGYSAFVFADPMVFVCHMLGLPVETQFAENECVYSTVKAGTKVTLTRNPDTDGCPICTVVDGKKFCCEDTLYINPFSWIPIWLRLDYDGDHVLIIVDPLIVRLYEKTKDIIGETPIVWVAPSGKKEVINASTIAEALVSSITGSKTGIHSDNVTKILNMSKEDLAEFKAKFGDDVALILWAIETKNVNVEIDAAKNAKAKKEENEEADKMLRALGKIKLPEFCRFAKASDEHPADDKYWDAKCAYTGSLLDIYSRTVRKTLPEELEVKGVDELVFDVYQLLIDPKRKASDGYIGLVGKGTYNQATGRFENEGVFNNIAFRATKEWALIVDDDAKKQKSDFRDLVREAALEEIRDFVEAQGGDLDGAYDIITRWLFSGTNGLSDAYFDIVARVYFDIFGEKMFGVLCMNLGFVPENYFERDDEEEGDND